MVRTKLALAGIRQRNPDASDAHIRIELARRLYGDAAAERLPPAYSMADAVHEALDVALREVVRVPPDIASR